MESLITSMFSFRGSLFGLDGMASERGRLKRLRIQRLSNLQDSFQRGCEIQNTCSDENVGRRGFKARLCVGGFAGAGGVGPARHRLSV